MHSISPEPRISHAHPGFAPSRKPQSGRMQIRIVARKSRKRKLADRDAQERVADKIRWETGRLLQVTRSEPRPEGSGWRLAVTHRTERGRPPCRVRLRDMARSRPDRDGRSSSPFRLRALRDASNVHGPQTRPFGALCPWFKQAGNDCLLQHREAHPARVRQRDGDPSRSAVRTSP